MPRGKAKSSTKKVESVSTEDVKVKVKSKRVGPKKTTPAQAAARKKFAERVKKVNALQEKHPTWSKKKCWAEVMKK